MEINMSEKRTDELYRVLQRKGYPDDFCREIAYKQMNTDYTAMRMLGYLYRISDPRPEDVVDEMLAILSDPLNQYLQPRLTRDGACSDHNESCIQRWAG